MPPSSPELEEHDRAWLREPGTRWFKRKPDFCSLTLVHAVEGKPETAGPAFTTRFRRCAPPLTPEEFQSIVNVRLGVELAGAGRGRITLRATERYGDELPPPRVIKIQFSVKLLAAEAFWAAVYRGKFFLWIFSTETFEARALVDSETGFVRGRYVTDRLVH